MLDFLRQIAYFEPQEVRRSKKFGRVYGNSFVGTV
jgi:hypothetical protein